MEEETVFNPLQFVFSLDTLRIILAYDFFVNRRFACVNATRGTGAALQKKIRLSRFMYCSYKENGVEKNGARCKMKLRIF